MNPMPEGRGLQLGRMARRVRLHDSSPTEDTDVLGSDGIGWASEATAGTQELGLGRAVGSGHLPTGRAGLASIVRVNHQNGHPSQACLVLQKGTKLAKGPGVLLATLRPANLNPRADALEVLQGDSPLRAFGLRHQLLADNVVNVPSEAALLAGALLEQSPGRLGAPGLEPSAELGVPFPEAVDLAPRVGFPIGVGGDVDYAQVHPQHICKLPGGRLRGVYGDIQVEDSIPVDQVGLAPPPVETGSLIGAKGHGDSLPAPQGQEADYLHALPGHNALVIGNGPMGPEPGLNAPIPFVGIYHFPDSVDGQLGGETKVSTDAVVDNLLEPNLVGAALPISYDGDGIAGSIKPLHSGQKAGILLRAGHQLHGQRLFHEGMLPQIPSIVKKGGGPSSPWLKPGDSGPTCC